MAEMNKFGWINKIKIVLRNMLWLLFIAFALIVDEIGERTEYRPHGRFDGTLAQKWGWVE